MREALEHPGRIDALFVERAMVRQSDTLYVLSGEESLGDPVAADTSSLDILLKELRNKFHYVVVDLPRQVSPATQHVVQSATNLVLVTDLSLAGMRDTLRQLTLLPTANAACQITVVANRVGEHRDGEIARKEFEAAIGRPIDFLIPFDARSVAAATNVGRPGGRRARQGGRRRSSWSPSGSPAIRPRSASRRAAAAAGRSASDEHVRAALGRQPQPSTRAGDADRAPIGARRAGVATRLHPQPQPPAPAAGPAHDRRVEALKSTHARIQAALYDRIDATAATKLPRDELNRQILELIAEVVAEQRLSPARPRAGGARRHHRRQHGRAWARSSRCCATRRSPTSW